MSPYFGVIDDALKDNISPQSPKVMNFYIHISYFKSLVRLLEYILILVSFKYNQF